MKNVSQIIKSARGFTHSIPEDSVEYSFTKKELYDLLSMVCEDQKEICNEYCSTSCLDANWPKYVYNEDY